MKKRNFFWLSAIVGTIAYTTVLFTGCKKDDPDNGNGKVDEDWDEVRSDFLPDSITSGTDFYIIFGEKSSYECLGNRVKEHALLRDIDVWPNGESLVGKDPVGLNSWGEPTEYLSFTVRGDWSDGSNLWNGGSLWTNLLQFSEEEYGAGHVPNLKDITDNPNDFYFHFALKSPNTQEDAGLVIFLYSDGTPTKPDGTGGAKYFFGPNYIVGQPTGATKKGNYPHDGEWHHFEIPVSELVNKNYKWDGPMHVWDGLDNDEVKQVYLFGFQSLPHKDGTEINLDAIFFYKKAK